MPYKRQSATDEMDSATEPIPLHTHLSDITNSEKNGILPLFIRSNRE